MKKKALPTLSLFLIPINYIGKNFIRSAIDYALIITGLAYTLYGAPALAKSTLDIVQESGILTVSYAVNSIPLSYVDTKGRPIGYAFELSKRISEALSKKLNGKKIKIKPIQVNLVSDRLRLVEEGEIQLECSTTTMTPDRSRRVNFSPAFYVGGARILVLRDSLIHNTTDLKNRKVIVTSGTTSQELLQYLNKVNHLNINISMADNHERAMEMLRTHRVDAFVLDDILLAGLISNYKHEGFEIVGTPLSEEAYGCMIRKSDKTFQDIVENEMARLRHTGELQKMYRRWFEAPIPPYNVSLNLKENEKTKKAISPEKQG